MARSILRSKSHNEKGENTFVSGLLRSHYMNLPGIPPARDMDINNWKRYRTSRYRQKNGFDAISFRHVLDALMNSSDPTVIIRAGTLANLLNMSFDALVWDSRTVGTILADIHVAFEDALGDKRGLLEKGPRDGISVYYYLHYNPKTALLARALLDDLFRMANAAARQQERGGGLPSTETHAIYDCPSLAQDWSNR